MEPTTIFDEQRPRLFGLAYRMLGCRADAEDVLQDAWLRWQSGGEGLRTPAAWLTTVVTRLSIDRLRHARVEREAYFGPWLPEPLSDDDLRGTEVAAELDDDVSMAFLVMLEALSPQERAAFVLRDVLDEDYADIAEAIGKAEPACRQLVHRARRHVSARRRRFDVDEAARLHVLEKLVPALARGDRDELLAMLAPDAMLISDGGGKAVAAIRPLHGADRIAWLWYAIARRLPKDTERRIIRVNGEPALAQIWSGRLHSVAVLETDGARIHRYYTVLNPDKLTSFSGLAALHAAG